MGAVCQGRGLMLTHYSTREESRKPPPSPPSPSCRCPLVEDTKSLPQGPAPTPPSRALRGKDIISSLCPLSPH